jgi:hypothetical protein
MTIAIVSFVSASIGTCFGFMICAACVAAKRADAIGDTMEKQMDDAA